MSAALFHLLHLTDATLPIGGFTHSAGLETYVQQGIVHNAATAKEFTEQMLSRNFKYNDAALASLAYDAACENDIEKLIELNSLCNAIKLPREMREASTKMGNRLLKIFEQVPDYKSCRLYKDALQQQQQAAHYCIVFALCAAGFGIGKMDMLTGFYYNAAAGFVSNCVKLIPLGQQQGQQLLQELHPVLCTLVQSSMQPDEDKIGMCSPGFDISQMQHEQLYSRLYMS